MSFLPVRFGHAPAAAMASGLTGTALDRGLLPGPGSTRACGDRLTPAPVRHMGRALQPAAQGVAVKPALTSASVVLLFEAGK